MTSTLNQLIDRERVRAVAPFAFAFVVTLMSLAFIGHANAETEMSFPVDGAQITSCVSEKEAPLAEPNRLIQFCLVKPASDSPLAMGQVVVQSASGHVERFSVAQIQNLLIRMDGGLRAQTWFLTSQDSERKLSVRVVVTSGETLVSASGQFDGRFFQLSR
jgi:hypothetical protein